MCNRPRGVSGRSPRAQRRVSMFRWVRLCNSRSLAKPRDHCSRCSQWVCFCIFDIERTAESRAKDPHLVTTPLRGAARARNSSCSQLHELRRPISPNHVGRYSFGGEEVLHFPAFNGFVFALLLFRRSFQNDDGAHLGRRDIQSSSFRWSSRRSFEG